MSTVNYDDKDIFVRPIDLAALAVRVKTTATSLSQHTETFFTALAVLAAQWDSDTSRLVTSYAAKLDPACAAVFGSDAAGAAAAAGAGTDGVLPTYVGYLEEAARGFSQTETTLVTDWQKFIDGLDNPDPGDKPSPPSTDPTRSALTFDAPVS